MKKWMCWGLSAGLILGLAVLGLAMAAAQPASSTQKQAGERAWLGVQLANLNQQLAQRLGLSRQEGAVILRVLPQSQATQAGLQVKDAILEINGQPVSRVAQVTEAVAQAKPGDKITLKIWRGGAERSLEITLGTPPAPPVSPKDRPPSLPFGGSLKDRLGDLGNLRERFLGGQFSFKDKEGQRVTFTVIAGTVTAVGTDSVTLTLNDDGSQSFQVTAETKILKGRQATTLSELKEGDRVVVTSTKPGVANAIVTQGPLPRAGRPFRHWLSQRP